MRKSSFDGRRMAWRVLGRWCRPTVDTFFAVVLFGVGGTLLFLLWTFEPPSLADQRAAEEEVRSQLIEELLREKDQLRKELDGLNSASNNDLHLREGTLNDRHRSDRRITGSRKRWADFDIDYDTGNKDKLPEVALQNTGINRTPKKTTRLSATRFDRETLDNNRMLSINSSVDNLLQKVRLKLFDEVTLKPEVDRRTQRSNNTQLLFGDGSSNLLDGSRRWCSVYNTTPEVSQSFDCIRLLIKPPTTVCLYPDADDIHVSRHLREDGLWEPHIVRLFQNLLFQNPDLSVIDIGAHIGQYSLLAASMGRRVVAVEPYPPSLRRLHKATKINKVEKQIVVVDNAVSDVRGTFQIGVPLDNQGGAHVRRESGEVGGDTVPCDRQSRCASNATTILMDDLVEVVNFYHAVMKIDIEGDERRAFFHADRLFDNVNIGYIFMEWIKLRAFYGADVDDTEDKRLVQRLVDWLTRRGYTAHSLILFQRLNPHYWYGWPEDIFWQHRDADQFL